jgi:2-methylaconitate cis-trans-isomerase PrpF
MLAYNLINIMVRFMEFAPAKRGYLLPTGEWNKEEIMLKGSTIKVTLNGTVINEVDIKEATKNGHS